MATEDRTSFVPSHHGNTVLPADPLFTRLLTLAHLHPTKPAVRDLNTDTTKTTAELLSDVLNLTQVLKASLASDIVSSLEKDETEVFISVLAPGGYEFTVAVLAVLALGAAASPLTILQPVDEAAYYVTKAKSAAVLVASQSPAQELGHALAERIQKTSNLSFQAIAISSFSGRPQIRLRDMIISSNHYRNQNKAGVVIFTSGTTGPPKGAVIRRASMTDCAVAIALHFNLQPGDTLLHLLPVHHATGIWVSFFPFLQSGACIEFRSGSFDPKWTWDRWKTSTHLTHFSGVPTIYMRMMRYYNETITKLDANEINQYRASAARFKGCFCGTSALPKPINDFWTDIMDGRRIVQRYGATETGVVFNMPISKSQQQCVPDGSVGEAMPGTDIRLLSDDPSVPNTTEDSEEGEILVRSHHMFSKYLHDPFATKSSHLPNGYFRSGDIARRRGKYYFIVGRASVDIIKSGGYKISALDVERELLALPYLSEVMVVGVPDEEFGQRVGAVVSIRDDELARKFWKETRKTQKFGELSIEKLRRDLRSRLVGYKLPTLLRVIEGELPKSATGKVVKKTLGPVYFSKEYRKDPAVQVWDRPRETDVVREGKL